MHSRTRLLSWTALALAMGVLHASPSGAEHPVCRFYGPETATYALYGCNAATAEGQQEVLGDLDEVRSSLADLEDGIAIEGTADVRVTNAPEEAVLTHEVREYIIARNIIDLAVGDDFSFGPLFVVPDDRRLVITSYSFSAGGDCAFYSYPRIDTFRMNTLEPLPGPGDFTWATVGSQKLELSFPPTSTVNARFARSSSDCFSSGTFIIHGYLEEDL